MPDTPPPSALPISSPPALSAGRVRVGTRGSRLARVQADFVADALRAANPGLTVEIVEITTTGDIDRHTPLTRFSRTGIFVAELEQALLDRRVDLAVHSLKDLPTTTSPGLVVLPLGPRADARDCLIAAEPFESIHDLPAQAVIGTSSIRRTSQIKALRPDLTVREIRGNVETRLRKIDAGDYAATILARAGLVRLGLESRATQIFEAAQMLPAPAQGVLGLQWREADHAAMLVLVESLRDPVVEAQATAEREFMATLEAGCHAPVGAWATPILGTDGLTLAGFVGTPDGRRILRDSHTITTIREAASLGRQLAETMRAAGGHDILAAAANAAVASSPDSEATSSSSTMD